MSKRLQAFARVRPFLLHLDDKNQEAQLISKDNKVISADGIEYTFERVFQGKVSNSDVYTQSLRPLLLDTLSQSINTTFFAYGQTCSGKTHTLFGKNNQSVQEDGIVVCALKDIFDLNIDQYEPKVKASISFYEIYNEQVTDLLSEKSNLQVKELNGAFALVGLFEKRVTEFEDAYNLIKLGNSNKSMGSSYLHDQSSRSHSVMRLHLAIQSKGICEINFVDLAGSEMLADNLGNSQQKETKNINMSLFNLKSVIQALSENQAFIPYRNSTLTKLLQNALGGNSQTAMLCMVSPLAMHMCHSKRTFAFGQTARKIVNNLLLPKEIYKKDSQVVKEEIRIDEREIKNKNTALQMNELQEELSRVYKIFEDGIQIFEYGDRNSKKLAFFLPAYGCRGNKCMLYSFQSLVNQGFLVASLDYPGQKESGGVKFNVRGHDQSVLLLDRILTQVFSDFKSILLLGYDYGAALAMNYVMINQKMQSKDRVKQIISFHPAWSQDLQLLKDIKIPIILLWVTAEQLHPISQGEKMNKIIPKCKLIKLHCGKFSADKPKKAYMCIGDKVTDAIIGNLEQSLRGVMNNSNKQSEEQQNGTIEKVEEEEEEEESKQDIEDPQQIAEEWDLDEILDRREEFLFFGKNVRGACLKKDLNKQAFKPEYLFQEGPPANVSSQYELNKWAVGRFKELLQSGEIKQYYKSYLTSGPLRTQAIKLFGNLPIFTPEERDLKKFQLFWGENNLPKGFNILDNHPRFLQGRRIHVRAKVNTQVFSENYLKFNESGELSITHNSFVESYNPFTKQFQIKILPDQVMQVSDSEIYRLNSSTNFIGNPLTDGVLFEDGIRCKYGDLLTRAKLAEAVISISNIVSEINFDSDSNEVKERNLQIQKQCTERISSVIDLIHLVQEGIHPTRFIAFECGKLSFFGQGNCHTLASVVCAFLMPFSYILGLEIKFRAGSLLKEGRDIDSQNQPLAKWDGKHPQKVEDHTWVEITYQPSQQSFLFDKSAKVYNVPIEEAYSRDSHISNRIQCNSKPPDPPLVVFSSLNQQ